MDEMGLKKDSDEGQQLYEKYLKERKTFIYNSVTVEGVEIKKTQIQCTATSGRAIRR